MATKYIEAEKLYKKVDELMAKFAELEKETETDDMSLSLPFYYQGRRKMCSEILTLIDSLQQEQPKCGCSEKPNNLLSEKRDLPEADLEKEIEQAGKDVIRQAHYHNKIFNIPQNIFDDVQLMDIFKAGAKWIAKQGTRKEE